MSHSASAVCDVYCSSHTIWLGVTVFTFFCFCRRKICYVGACTFLTARNERDLVGWHRLFVIVAAKVFINFSYDSWKTHSVSFLLSLSPVGVFLVNMSFINLVKRLQTSIEQIGRLSVIRNWPPLRSARYKMVQKLHRRIPCKKWKYYRLLRFS